MTRTLIATDLDRTLIYSRAAAGEALQLTPVERYEDADASWMTTRAARVFARLHEVAHVVPVTTRTPAQWRRIRLPGPPPRYAITANGGLLLVDDAVDESWSALVRARLAAVAPLAEIWRQASTLCRPEWTRTLRNAEGLFCYAVLERARVPDGLVAEAAEWADGRGWALSLQGRKLYWVPRPLSKISAATEVARRSGAEQLLAAGDSLLDADLLAGADAGIAARHGELVASGWSAPHVDVTATAGATAGEEIVDWFATHA